MAPCAYRGHFWALSGSQRPHESTGGFLGPMGAFFKGRGETPAAAPTPSPPGAHFLGELKIWNPPQARRVHIFGPNSKSGTDP